MIGDERLALSTDDRALVRGLADKYARMIALRRTLGRGAPSSADRALLASLARDFPGSLRELETLTTVELEQRLASTTANDVPAWLVWTAHYHALMRDALALRRQGSAETAPHGRLNVVVFAALAARFGEPRDAIWDRLFPKRGSAPRPYR